MTTAPEIHPDIAADTAAGVLAGLRTSRRAADREETRLLRLAVEWAAMHSVDSIDDAAVFGGPCSGDVAFPVAGPGAPLVAEFCVGEFAAAVGLPTEVGKAQLGEAVELRYRLPKVWARVLGGDLVAWRARRIARTTISQGLSPEAATFVDQQVAGFAHKIRPSGVDRLVEEAVTRFMPAEARRRRQAAADGRHVGVNTSQVSFEGTVWLEGEVDLADGLDLDAALGHRATQLSALGSEDTLDVRRSVALGDLARAQLALDLETDPATDTDAGVSTSGAEDGGRAASSGERVETRGETRKPRQVVLYVHLSEHAIRGTGDLHLARVENTRSFVAADQVKTWCANPEAQVTVKPVIDLNEHIHVTAYEVPDRLAEQAALVDVHCIFPWCTRPARRLEPDRHRADCDHAREYNQGGSTCSCNIAPLCRRHHRLKTHTAWRYTVVERGTYLWTSPHGYQFLRDHHGTLDVSRDRRPPPDPQPPDG